MDTRRVVLDCRSKPEANCSLTIAGTEAEVLDVAEYHVTSKHGMKKEPALREQLKGFLKEEALSR
ncbi:MAG: DUF1059 domain-containing protein [Elusimicrobiota bacterium]